MAYLHTLPEFPEMEKLFNNNGYNIEVDLSNSLIIEPVNNPGEWVEYDQLPESLRNALYIFCEKNNIN